MSDVFVSYKAEDRRRVKPLVDALESEGFSVWWDEQIGGGATWRHAIEAELNSAKCVIVAWSKRSVGEEGTCVQDEATRAQQRHVYVPVLIDKVHLPLGFGETQALSLAGWHGDRADPRYDAVLSAVRRNVGGKARPRSRPVAAARVDRRSVIAGGAAATVAVAGFGAWELLKPSAASASGSIAVLPFSNLSGDPAQAYFSDGVAEEIRSALTRIAGLKVAGSTSSEAVRNEDAQTAAKKLDVSNILTGSVRQSPSTIRVSAELIDGRTGMDRWSQDYDRSPGDAIKIQTDIAQNVATALSAALTGAARKAINVGGTQNPEAQRLYMQVRELTKGPPAKEMLEQGIRLLDSAISIDPNYADAYALKAGLVTTYGNNYANGSQMLAENRAEALRLAQTALRLAPKLAIAHLALFSVYSSNLQMAAAYDEIRRAVQLGAGNAGILASYADFSGSTLGNFNDAFRLADQSIGVDPLNPRPYGMRLSLLLAARRYADTLNYETQIEHQFPPAFGRSLIVGTALMMLGRFQEAQKHFDQAPADYWGRLFSETVLRIRSGDRGGADAKLKEFQAVAGDAGSYQYGVIAAQMGDRDRAFENLGHAFAIKDGGMLQIRTDPMLDPLRSDPRYATLIARMNFPA